MDFPCQASGYPQPVIAWTRGNSPLPQDRRHQVLSSGTLRVTRVAAHDEGQYECEAVSPVGTARAAVQLSIQQRGEGTPRPGGGRARPVSCVYSCVMTYIIVQRFFIVFRIHTKKK